MQEHEREKIFYKEAKDFSKESNLEILRYCVGALLYVPAIQKEMLLKCINKKVKGLISLAICLEDSVGAYGEEEAIRNLEEILIMLRSKKRIKEEMPLIFIRPKNIFQTNRIGHILQENKEVISGIIIPKANGDVIYSFLRVLEELECEKFYVMPIIETTEFVSSNLKKEAFSKLYDILSMYKDRILNLRIGVTDLLGQFNLRRNKKNTIYDNIIFVNFAADILTFINEGELNIPISAGVSEYYNMINNDILESYIKEIEIDKINGFIGKTVIHPLQLSIVQAMSVITYEDYKDAVRIYESINSKFAISRSIYGERMNELNPHLSWAKKILKLSEIYGVLNEGVDSSELFRF